jgi:hypothetical protein
MVKPEVSCSLNSNEWVLSASRTDLIHYYWTVDIRVWILYDSNSTFATINSSLPVEVVLHRAGIQIPDHRDPAAAAADNGSIAIRRTIPFEQDINCFAAPAAAAASIKHGHTP